MKIYSLQVVITLWESKHTMCWAQFHG